MLGTLKLSLLQYDLERKPALLFLGVILGVYIFISSFELQLEKEDCENFGYFEGYCGDYKIKFALLERYDQFTIFNPHFDKFEHDEFNYRHFLSDEITYYSNVFFGDYRILSFVSSVLLLVLIYFVTNEITKTNFAGLVAVLVVLTSPIFYKYDVIMTYPNFYTTAYLASIYVMFKVWKLAPVAYWLSIPLKALNVLSAPASAVFVAFSDFPRKRKIILMVVHLAAIPLFLYLFFTNPFINGDANIHGVNFEDFLWWLGMWSVEFTNSRATLILFMVSLVGLLFLRRAKVAYASSLIGMLLIFMIQPAIIAGFTEFTNEEYRLLPMISFVGVSIGLIISNLDRIAVELRKMQNQMQSQQIK